MKIDKVVSDLSDRVEKLKEDYSTFIDNYDHLIEMVDKQKSNIEKLEELTRRLKDDFEKIKGSTLF